MRICIDWEIETVQFVYIDIEFLSGKREIAFSMDRENFYIDIEFLSRNVISL